MRSRRVEACSQANSILLLLGFILLPAGAFAGGGGCTGNGCSVMMLCVVPNTAPNSEKQTTLPIQAYLDSLSDMGDVAIVSPTIRQTTWSRVSAEGTMGEFGDLSVSLDPSQGPSIYRMTSQSPTGTPFFPADVECEFFWRFEIHKSPLTGAPLVLQSNRVVYRARNVGSFPPPPGTVFTLATTMRLANPEAPAITCTALPESGRVVYSGQGVIPAVLINEIDIDDGGANRQFLELYDGGAGKTSLKDVSVVLYSGDEDQPYEILKLTGHSTNQAGFFVIGDQGVANVDLPKTTRWRLGPGAVGLYVTPEGTFSPGTAPTTNQLMDAVVFGPAAPLEHPGLLRLIRPGMPQADERFSGKSAAHSLQRVPDGGWRRDNRHFQARLPTPGRLNASSVDPAPPTPTPSSPTASPQRLYE